MAMITLIPVLSIEEISARIHPSSEDLRSSTGPVEPFDIGRRWRELAETTQR